MIPVLALFLGITLTACGEKAEIDAPTNQPTLAQSDESTSLHLMRSGYPLGTSSDNGYYYFRCRDDASLNICYIDYASNQKLVLCNQPNCLHNSDSCDAWIPYTGSTAGIYEIDGKLYIIHYGSVSTADYELFGEAAAPNIEVRNTDGTNPATLLQLSSNSYFSGDFATDENYLYGMLEQVQSSENDNINVATQLVRISLEDGSLETIYKTDQLGASIAGASGQCLVLSYYAVDSTAESLLPSTLCYESYDITTGKVSSLCAFSRSDGAGICVGDDLIFINKATHEVKSYAIQTGIEQPLYTLSLDGYSDLYCSYALSDSILLLLYPKDQDADVVHALLSVDSGDLFEITTPMNSDETSNGKTQIIEIVAEIEENFLVMSGIYYQNVSFQTGDNESIALPSAYYEFSTIKKEDFLNDRNHFTQIEELTN